MKKIVLSIFFISILFFGCKSTDNISQSNLPENQSELNTTVSEVEPIEPQSKDEEKSIPDSEKITDNGDLPLPLYDEFIPLIDEDEFTDEIFYGEDFLPQDKIEEDSMQNLQENLLQENNLTENILPEEILNIPKYGCINVHGSLLPQYRGSAPIQWSIINGDQKTGITTMYMDKGMDTGDMILKEEIEILDVDTFGTLYEKLKNIILES